MLPWELLETTPRLCLKKRLQTEQDTASVMSSAEWEKCSFLLCNYVGSIPIECFSCSFAVLRGPKSAFAENTWQWHIQRGFFKVFTLSSLCGFHAFHSLPLKYPHISDREGGWPLTSEATEVSNGLPSPSVNQHITTNPDTTRWNVTSRWHPNILNKHDQNKTNEAFFLISLK